MPVLMIASAGPAIANASVMGGHGGPDPLRWAASASLTLALVSTIIVNVPPINLATARLDPAAPPSDWSSLRNRWELFQGIRSWLLVIGFVLICVGFASG
jgi:Anthrone oxygenase